MSHQAVHYVQCHLVRGRTHQTAWIPEKFAQEGRYLKLKQPEGWEDGWQVTAAGARLPGDYVMERSRDYLATRKASDI